MRMSTRELTSTWLFITENIETTEPVPFTSTEGDDDDNLDLLPGLLRRSVCPDLLLPEPKEADSSWKTRLPSISTWPILGRGRSPRIFPLLPVDSSSKTSESSSVVGAGKVSDSTADGSIVGGLLLIFSLIIRESWSFTGLLKRTDAVRELPTILLPLLWPLVNGNFTLQN